MIPKENRLLNFELQEIPWKTYKLNIEGQNISGYCDGLEAVKQAAYLILNTERYENIIYSWDYGIELNNLYGKDPDYVCAVVKRIIEEALLQDERIRSVDSFSFNKNKNKVVVSFVINTDIGSISEEKEMII